MQIKSDTIYAQKLIGCLAKIKRGTEFAEQIRDSGGEYGVIVSLEDGSRCLWVSVRFPNGYKNCYPHEDLTIQVVEQKNSDYKRLLSAKPEHVLED